VRRIGYHNSAEPKIPPQGEHSILTVAPHCIRASLYRIVRSAKAHRSANCTWDRTTIRLLGANNRTYPSSVTLRIKEVRNKPD